MPDLTPTTHDWTHEPGGFRVVLEPCDHGVYGYIEERAEDGTINSHLITWGSMNHLANMRAEVNMWLDLGAINQETASMLLAQLADHD